MADIGSICGANGVKLIPWLANSPISERNTVESISREATTEESVHKLKPPEDSLPTCFDPIGPSTQTVAT